MKTNTIGKILFGRANEESTVEDYVGDINKVIQRKDDYIKLKNRIKNCDYDERMTALHRYEMRKEDVTCKQNEVGIAGAIMIIPCINISSEFAYAISGEGRIIAFLISIAIIFIWGIVVFRGILSASRDAREYAMIIRIIQEVNEEEANKQKLKNNISNIDVPKN